MLILASASPRRHDLLQAAGIAHLVRPASIPEIRRRKESPGAFVRRLAREKAAAVSRDPGDIVLAADTIVFARGNVLGKPADEADAYRMLRLLSGRTHVVYTGICLCRDSRSIIDCARTSVTFTRLTEAELSEYTRSGEPVGKAGAYAIQGLASKFVLSVRGSYENVVGLPVSLVYRHLKVLASS